MEEIKNFKDLIEKYNIDDTITGQIKSSFKEYNSRALSNRDLSEVDSDRKLMPMNSTSPYKSNKRTHAKTKSQAMNSISLGKILPNKEIVFD